MESAKTKKTKRNEKKTKRNNNGKKETLQVFFSSSKVLMTEVGWYVFSATRQEWRCPCVSIAS